MLRKLPAPAPAAVLEVVGALLLDPDVDPEVDPDVDPAPAPAPAPAPELPEVLESDGDL